MYITITPQKLGENYSQSSAGFVEYLEKENQGMEKEEMNHFFNQYGDEISAGEVVREIDGNTAKLEKTEPRFYSITVSPSKYELNRLPISSEDLKRYTRELMKDYVASFNREINGRQVKLEDIKYYAKIERGEMDGTIKIREQQIVKLEKEAPHQQSRKRIVQGMQKDGPQSHIHIIVSRKDASNKYSLSPGSKYKASEVELNGKTVQRGFDRYQFFKNAEKTFDRTFGYQRNFLENYTSRKEFVKNPKMYFSALMKLPTNEKAIAFKILRESGMPMLPGKPVNQAQLALKVFNRLRRGLDIAVKSSSIGI